MTTEKAILSLDRKETRTIFSKTPNYLPLCPKMSISVHSFQLITKIYADGNAWQQANTQNLLWVKKKTLKDWKLLHYILLKGLEICSFEMPASHKIKIPYFRNGFLDSVNLQIP